MGEILETITEIIDEALDTINRQQSSIMELEARISKIERRMEDDLK